MDAATRARLIDVAAGREPADLLIRNAKVVDVFGGAILKTPVSVVGGYFAGLHEVKAEKTLDAQGRYMLPGLMDGHVHIESSMLVPERFADAVVPRGTTTVIVDPHEIANVAGREGLDYMFRASEDLALDVRFNLPSCVPATPFEDAGATLTVDDLAPYINHARVLGLAEMMNFPGVICKEPDVLAKLELALSRNKRVDGHAPGLGGRELDAYIAAGVSSDHECASVEEIRDRISRGMFVHLRQGSAVRNLSALLPGVTLSGLRRCLFCTDDAHPETLIGEGHMDRHLRLAVADGLDPVLAIIMATLNVAECYGLNKGAIAPGREADFVLMQDLKEFRAQQVYVQGRLTAERGRMLRPSPLRSSEALTRSVRIASLPDDAFDLRLTSGRARVIGVQPGSLLTRDLERDVQVAEGVFDPSRNPGLNLLAVIERHHATGRIGLGLVEGYGLKGGAAASTVAHDSHNIVIAGDNAADMLLAAATLCEQGGGVVVCRNREVAGNLPLPVGGLMSTAPVAEVNAVFTEMTRFAHAELGIPANVDPFMTLSFLSLPVIPALKLTARGLFDVQRFCFTPVDVQ
jgi:adenine deaminase